MIRKLRFKLISAAMISLFIVITIIIGIVNILNYHGIVQDADGILTILQDNNGRFPQQNTQTDITKQSPEAPVFSRFFWMKTEQFSQQTQAKLPL